MIPFTRQAGYVYCAILALAVISANVIVAKTIPFELGPFILTWAFWISAVFVVRDFIQVSLGRKEAYLAVAAALAINFLASFFLDNLWWVTLGSTAAFICSMTFDAEVFTRIHRSLFGKTAISGVLSVLVDTVVFTTLALSPLTTGFVAWEDMWRVVVGEMIVKMIVVLLCATSVYKRAVPIQ